MPEERVLNKRRRPKALECGIRQSLRGTCGGQVGFVREPLTEQIEIGLERIGGASLPLPALTEDLESGGANLGLGVPRQVRPL